MKNLTLYFVILIIMAISCNRNNQTVQVNRPFPQNIDYPVEHLMPTTMSRDELSSYVSDYYDQWKSRFIKECDDGIYYVNFEQENVSTVSEAMGYGMMIVAYMAGYDPEAKRIFDGMYSFYKKHPSSICKYFMAWRQGTECQSTGYDSATDGDEDIAFALLLADAQWGSQGEINYLAEAKTLIQALRNCAFHVQGFPLLGDWAQSSSVEYSTATRSSDWMLDHYLAFYHATNDTFWLLVTKKITQIIDTIQAKYSPQTGLIPDFIIYADKSPQPAQPNFLEGPYDGAVYYNACRTPWRLATGQLFGVNLSSNPLTKINSWIAQITGGDANNIVAGYSLNGSPIHDFQDIAFTGGFAVAAMLGNNQQWLNSCFNALIIPSFRDYSYYGNTLRMLYLLVLSGNYWIP